jgi:3-deoxy-7-phosphoheptulonate synthase
MTDGINEPYKLASRSYKAEDTVVRVGNICFGGKSPLAVIAGPCSVENENRMMLTASAVKAAGASVLRGGAFKPRSSPYSFQGLGLDGLKILHAAGIEYDMPVVSELTGIKYLDDVMRYADLIQVGAKNMQNYELLKELGSVKKPVLLKRGPGASIEEWLLCAEYILTGGNPNVILCERGIRTFERMTRYTLDISSIPLIASLSHLPVISDPSHAAGEWSLVEPLALASVAAGAHGLMIEVHDNPECARSDGPQSLKSGRFAILMQKCLSLRDVLSSFPVPDTSL